MQKVMTYYNANQNQEHDYKQEEDNLYFKDIVPTQTIVFIFSFLDLMDLVKSATRINKQFHHYVMECSSHLWRQYCKSHHIKNPDSNRISWKSLAINNINSSISISNLIRWDFPTLHQHRYNIQSKYIYEIINDGLVNLKQNAIDNGDNEHKHQLDDKQIFEYESVELHDNSMTKRIVKSDNKEVLYIDSFILQSFDKLRALGNINLDQERRGNDDIWEGYTRRGDAYWRATNPDSNTIQEWLHGALSPSDEYMYNLYCLNNRRGMGEFGTTPEEQKEDDDYIDSAQEFIDLVTKIFCEEKDNYRFYIAGHIASDELDLDRDEMIIAINDIKVFGFYVYYDRYYG